MNKGLLIKFFRGEVTESEVDSIIEWVEKSPHNKSYFVKLKALWTITSQESTYKVTKSKFPSWKVLNLSAAAIVAVLLTINLMLDSKKETQSNDFTSLTAELPIQRERTLYTEKGVKGFLFLPDGSKVWLNSDSKIVYPDVFDEGIRKVEITGEAYFEVKKNINRPMLVKTNRGFRIKVLGTSFLVKSYENDSEAKTTLYSGSISLYYKNNKTLKEEITELHPDESFIYYDDNKAPSLIKKGDPSKQLAWKEGELFFDQTPMSEVIKMLERWHGTQFTVKENSIYKYNLSATFHSESIVQILEMIKLCLPIDYKIDGNFVTILKKSD